MGRNRFLFGLALGCWSLVAMPALCTAGLLHHACDCEHAEDEECGHEAQCETDPCEEAIARPSEANDFIADMQHAQSVALPVVSLLDPSHLGPLTWESPPDLSFHSPAMLPIASVVLLI